MIDSHCHLDFDQFDGRRDEVLDAARAAGVHTVVNIGVDLASSEKSVQLAEQYDMVYASVGVHPHDARIFDDETHDRLAELAGHDKVVAIGEIGLDYYRDLSPRKVQRAVFRRQLELAAEHGLPVVIHTRQALDEAVEIIQDYAPQLAGGVFHCFEGDTDSAYRVFELGLVISVGGVITFKNSRMSRVTAAVPLEKIILETDAPFLTPEPFRGKTNSPAYVRYVYEKVAELKEIQVAEVERIVDRTCRKLFRMVETFGD